MIAKLNQHFRLEEHNGRLTVWIDVVDSSVNVFNTSVIEQLEDVVRELERSAAKVVLFRSAKASGFFAGADVRQIAELKTTQEVQHVVARGQDLFDRIERLPMPTVAVIHGPCLGGGLEFALACTYRIAVDSNSTRLGLPEVQLGLIPGWGGTQRLPRRIGLLAALPMIVQSSKLTAAKSLKLGLVDHLVHVEAQESAVQEFADGVVSGQRVSAVQGGWKSTFVRTAANSIIGRWFILRSAERRIARDSEHYPALSAALTAIRAGLDGRRDGLATERVEFAKLIQTSTCQNLLKIFFWREQARSGSIVRPTASVSGADLSRSERLSASDFANRSGNDTADSTDSSQETINGTDEVRASSKLPPLKTVGIVGAGAMGAGIGQLAALKGYHVVLKELNRELADAGRKSVAGLLNEMVSKRRLTSVECDQTLALVTATDSYDDLAHCDLVIEAVVEKMDVKRGVFAALDNVLPAHAIIASNTSALSVSDMASATTRRDRVAGLHFFNPVHRMDLVEIVRASDTSDNSLEVLQKLVKRLGKTPIVTSDSPGFLVNRVLFPYIGEAVRMVMEGHSSRELDREIKRFGMPMGPIELIDHVGLDVAWHVAETLKDVLPESGNVIRFLGSMVARGWTGKKSGRGFYAYSNGKRGDATDLTALITASAAHDRSATEDRAMTKRVDDSSAAHPHIGRFLSDGLTDMQRRLVYPMINEVGFCMQDGVVAEPWMADLAMILGTGFAPFRGGPMRLADAIGRQTLRNNLHVLSVRYGQRFKPSAWLVEHGRKVPEDSTMCEPC